MPAGRGRPTCQPSSLTAAPSTRDRGNGAQAVFLLHLKMEATAKADKWLDPVRPGQTPHLGIGGTSYTELVPLDDDDDLRQCRATRGVSRDLI